MVSETFHYVNMIIVFFNLHAIRAKTMGIFPGNFQTIFVKSGVDSIEGGGKNETLEEDFSQM